jgi:hypothetical protein
MTEMPASGLEYIKQYSNKEESNYCTIRRPIRQPREAGISRRPRVVRLPAYAGGSCLRASRLWRTHICEVGFCPRSYARAACRIVLRMNMKSREWSASPIMATFESIAHSALVIW